MANCVRVWVDGKLNITPDVGSRLSWEYDVVRSLPVPHKPILDIIRMFFRHPDDVRAEFSKDTTRTPLLNTNKTGTGRSNPDYRFYPDELTTGDDAPVEDSQNGVSPSAAPQPPGPLPR